MTSRTEADPSGLTAPTTRAMDLRTDPRSDPRMLAALAPFGLDTRAAPPPVDATAALEAKLAFCAEAEAGFEALFETLMTGLPPVPGLTQRTETIQGAGGHDIGLYITRPANASGPLPSVLHLHGGGMVMLRAAGPAYARFRDELAATGLVVVGVEYRNAGGVLGSHPFPAGLEDCATALEWLHEHREELGASRVVVAGESGGGNLSLATALKANRDGQPHRIDGVYAMMPYISGAYGWSEADRARELPSLVEHDGYFISTALAAVLASVYDPDGTHATDPLCWPYHATEADLVGLPPHVIAVEELDPLRDEGLAYFRKLARAGVAVTGPRVVPWRGADVPGRNARPVRGYHRRHLPLRDPARQLTR